MSQCTEDELVDLIINANNFFDIISLYHCNITQLKDYTILIFDDEITKSINISPPVNLTDKLKAVKIVSIFNSSFCLVNESMYGKMLNAPNAGFHYKNCFDLDINIMNILEAYHDNIRGEECNSILLDLELFSKDVTCYPYIFENAGKLKDKKLEICVYKTLLMFNKFKHSNLNTFSTEYSNLEQDFQDAHKTINMMKEIASDKESINSKAQKYIYALLLKTAILSLRDKNGIKKKLLELMAFINNELGIFFERETVYCYWFLKDKNDERIRKFFRYIQLNTTDILATIQGMAWDLFHLRFCTEIATANDIENGKELCIHYLVTKDMGLSDLADAHPIKFFIYKKGSIAPKIVCSTPIYEVITEVNILQILKENLETRREIYLGNNIDYLIEILEQNLRTICYVK